LVAIVCICCGPSKAERPGGVRIDDRRAHAVNADNDRTERHRIDLDAVRWLVGAVSPEPLNGMEQRAMGMCPPEMAGIPDDELVASALGTQRLGRGAEAFKLLRSPTAKFIAVRLSDQSLGKKVERPCKICLRGDLPFRHRPKWQVCRPVRLAGGEAR
jgi:hypothetical protein